MNNKEMNSSRLILFFLKGSKRYFVLSALFAVCLVVFELINPRVLGYSIDFIIGDMDQMPEWLLELIERCNGRDYLIHRLWIIGLVVIGISLVGALFRYLFMITNSKGSEHLVLRMRDVLYHHIIRLPFCWFDQNKTGDIIQRCTSDVDMIKNFISNQLTNLVRMGLMIVLALVFMGGISLKLTAIIFFFIPILIIYSLLFHNKIAASFEKVDNEEGKLSAVVQENLAGVRVVRAFGRESYERERFESKNEVYTGMWVHMMKILTRFWITSDVIASLQMVTLLVFGAYFTINGSITSGEFVAFIAYERLLMWPVRELGRIISDMGKAGVSLDRLKYIMNSEEEKDDENAVDFPEDKTICFEGVSFAYTSENKDVLSKVSFTIKPGETIGIIGATGCGKTTILQLLGNFYELARDKGTITVGGIDIRNIKKSELRKNIGYVLQEPFLFSKNLEENITVTRSEVSKEELDTAIRRAALTGTVKKFKDGLKTMVGERGVTLSGGQKQRTAIAQIFIANPPILVFDDSLSAVDSATDMEIRKGIREAGRDNTLIIVSHRVTSIMDASQIFVLEEGRIVESGNHEQLIEIGGRYKNIYELQTRGLF